MKTLQQIDWLTSLKESAHKIKGYRIDWLKWTLIALFGAVLVHQALINMI